MESENQQVAIFIDFENLVFGIQNPQKPNSDEEEVDVEPVVRLAEEYGRVVQAHAYADWRNRVFNQYQVDLYKLGLDIVHVMGKKNRTGFKNAVDIKMAVDTIETIFTFPEVSTYIIVSGDRDFIHVLKMLRRHGKNVVGISPARSASEDLAQLTDRFIRYESLTNTYFNQNEEAEEEGFETKLINLQAALVDIVSKRPEGVKGAELKGLLRRKISATFDESDYGFSRLIDLVRAFPKDLRVEMSRGGGDMTVLPVTSSDASGTQQARKPSPRANVEKLTKVAGLRRYRYEVNARKRRKILKAMFEAMKGSSFSQNDVYDQMQNQTDLQDVSATELSKYFLILFQSRVLWTESPSEEELPVRARKMTLNKTIKSADDLIQVYETSIVYKVIDNKESEKSSSQELCALLGLNPGREQKYVEKLLKKAKEI